MAKLSTIEDVEQRAQNPEPVQDVSSSPSAKPVAEEPKSISKPTVEEKIAADIDMTAEQEEEYHGLDAQQPMSLGHKTLIIIAAAVLVVAILYIVNSWIHFV